MLIPCPTSITDFRVIYLDMKNIKKSNFAALYKNHTFIFEERIWRKNSSKQVMGNTYHEFFR
jgi:hypothetical protein